MNTPFKTAAMMALKDISEYLKPLLKEQHHEENYIITSTYIHTKETRKLNRELGMGGINKKK